MTQITESREKQIAKRLDLNLKHAAKNVNAFYSKAMLKRKQRTIKEISKKRPQLAMRLRKVVS
jgi:hypothetical protein